MYIIVVLKRLSALLLILITNILRLCRIYIFAPFEREKDNWERPSHCIALYSHVRLWKTSSIDPFSELVS